MGTESGKMGDQPQSLQFKYGYSGSQNIGLEVITLGELRIKTLNAKKPAPIRHEFFVLFHVTSGPGTYFVDFKRYPVQKGDSLFLHAGQVHVMGDEATLDGTLVLFTPEFLTISKPHLAESSLFNHYLYPPLLKAAKAKNELPGLFEQLSREFQAGESRHSTEILRCYLELILMKAEESEVYAPNPAIQNKYWLEFSKFRKVVEEQFRQFRNVKDIAREMGMSTKKINDLSRMFTEFSAKEFIDQRVTLEVKRQLSTRDLSVNELAWELGFDEPSNLVKYFKRLTGLTPGEFRNGQE